MAALVPWYALSGVATLINCLVLGYLSRREGSPALRLWAWAFFAWAAAIVPLARLDRAPHEPLPALLCGAAWVVSTTCFLAGSYRLSERRMPRGWYAIAGACAITALLLGIAPSDAGGMLPLVLFQAVGLGTAGVLIIRAGRGRAGAWLSGGALIGLAVHLFDAPFLAARPQLMPWGFVVATGLEVLAALGMVTLYYEQARAQLVDTMRALGETRRIEALGRVAGGVAHDFNNMLMVMQGHLELVRMELGAEVDARESIAESLQAMERATAQAGRLTAQLLAFGRRSVIQAQVIDVRQVIGGTLELLKTLIPENISVRYTCGPGDYVAAMDRSLLEQIVLNLVTNARDAISGPGHISVELERTSSPESGLRLRVIDDGDGIEQSSLSQVFEPFFSTKAEGRGTGLGLASVQGAVSQLGGQIRVESRRGEGTRFDISLPLAQAEELPAQSAASPSTGPLDILVVDDSRPVREVSARMLGSAGHRVHQAADGAQALEMVRERHYDVVLSDIVMPHMSGVELARAVASVRPEVLMVLTSGYPAGAPLDLAEVHFLPKPFQRDTLLAMLERLMAEHRRTCDAHLDSAAARPHPPGHQPNQACMSYCRSRT